jgi:hypothetical protein
MDFVLLAGLGLVISGVLPGVSPEGRVNGILSGVCVAALSLPRGKINEHYGGWDRLIK